MLGRIVRAARNLLDELVKARRACDDFKSFLRLSADLIRYRVHSAQGLGFDGRERTVRFRGGVRLTYRFDPGDIWSVREVWLYEIYRLPFKARPERVIDLGANIGSTSIWLAKRYSCVQVIAVEPSPSNARLARVNIEANSVPVELIEAAVGPEDGTIRFLMHEASNRGRTGHGDLEVPMLSMATIQDKLPEGTTADLVKVDIEGGEQALFMGDLDWLGRVRSLICEFHPALVDYPGLIARIEGAGFRYIAHNTIFSDNMDAFIRRSPT